MLHFATFTRYTFVEYDILMTEIEFEKNIMAMQSRMVQFAFTILHSQVEAEDAVSELIAKLWDKRNNLSKYKNINSFLLVSVRNAAYDVIRQRREKSELSEEIEDFSTSVNREDNISLVRFAIAQLSIKQREIIHLKELEGYNNSEIANMLQTTETNIRMILSRARKSLRDKIIELS